MSNKAELIIVAVLSVVVLALAFYLPAVRTGDGGYYYEMLNSLGRNHSVAITEELRQMVSARIGYPLADLERKGLDGLNYPIHFFAYPLLSVPAFYFTKLLHIDDLKSFQITNACIIIAFLIYVLIRCKSAALIRWAVAASFLLSVGMFYFQWTHPEILTGACVLAASLAFYEKRYLEASLLSAVGSLQNPSAIFLVAISLGFFLLELVLEFKRDRRLSRFARLLPAVPIGLLAISPYLWSLWKFGILNPIVGSGAIDYGLISLGRLYSTYFDLNQGLVVGMPWLVLAVPAALVGRVARTATAKDALLKREDILILASVLMSIPTLAQLNWNSDNSVFARYASWIGMPIVVWTVVSVCALEARTRSLILIASLVIQSALVVVMGGMLKERHPRYVELQPWIRSIWARWPELYDPVPEIFYERVAGQEGAPSLPLVYSPIPGVMTKILTRTTDLHEVSAQVCGSGGVLRSLGDETRLSFSAVEGGLFYINGIMVCRYDVPTEIHLGNVTNPYMLTSGWSRPEATGVWSDSASARIVIPLAQASLGSLGVRITGFAFVTDRNSDQRIKVRSGSATLDAWTSSLGHERFDRAFRVKTQLVNGVQSVVLDFDLPDSISPKHVGASGDERQLGIYIETLELEP